MSWKQIFGEDGRGEPLGEVEREPNEYGQFKWRAGGKTGSAPNRKAADDAVKKHSGQTGHGKKKK